MPENLSLENPLVIIGDADVVLGFSALGFQVYPLREPSEFKSVLAEVVRHKIGICLLQDNIYENAKDQIESFKGLALPVFIPFSKTKKADLLESLIKDIRLKATGAF